MVRHHICCFLDFWPNQRLFLLQLTPALKDFKGPTIFICYRWISEIANKEIKDIFFKGPKIPSVVGGFPLLEDPIERDSTVVLSDPNDMPVNFQQRDLLTN